MTIPYSLPPTPCTKPIDILAIAAHRDDVEQTCGGTLLVQQSLGFMGIAIFTSQNIKDKTPQFGIGLCQTI